MNRLRELDFLRGVAILLVLLRHIPLFSFTTNMGWIGVDLFFVLSGFLVSGLLFKEYIKFGNIQPKLFLIRRGFKIYPIYFLFYFLYLIPEIINDSFNVKGFIGDITFIQNYLSGWGYAYAASWSLAVEEHFYFLFAFFLWLSLRLSKNILQFKSIVNSKIKFFELTVIVILVIILLLRLVSNIIFSEQETRNFTMTHLRIDSLLFGVLISYFFYFRKSYIENFYKKSQNILCFICFCGLLWTPFINPVPSFFVRTFGFSIIYLSFGILLIIFLLKNNINIILNKLFTFYIVDLISKIGYCSYSIYIIHTFCIRHSVSIGIIYFDFVITSTISIITGMFMTFKIEKYFLRIRDRYYPSRV